MVEFVSDNLGEFVNFIMCFMNVQIQGNCEVTIHMQGTAIFYNSEIVEIYPIFTAVLVKDLHQSFQKFGIAFVHDTSY